MGEGQYECKVKGCHEYWTHMLGLLTEEEYSRDMVCGTSGDRLLALCDRHSRYFWDACQAIANTPIELKEEESDQEEET